jgi:hypothetical protein
VNDLAVAGRDVSGLRDGAGTQSAALELLNVLSENTQRLE